MKYLALMLALVAGPVAAQTNCGDRQAVIDMLANGYGEHVQTRALTSDMVILEVYANTATGTWTITLTTPGGPSCIVSAGEAYAAINTPMGEGA